MDRRIATLFGIGHLRPAPGTWASALATVVAMLVLHLGFFTLLALTVCAIALGFKVCAGLAPGEDPAEVVIDELAGQWIALLFPAAGFAFSPMASAWVAAHGGWLPWPAWLFPFALFRLFDIWKPGPIGRADRRGDPAGVMLDDLWAGLFAGLATVILAAAWHIPMALMR